MRKNQEDTAITVRTILDASLQVFMRKGYEATKLSDISDLIGYTRNPIYYHFQNKKCLYEKTIEYYNQNRIKDYEKIFSGESFFEEFRQDLAFMGPTYGNSETLYLDIDKIPELASVRDMREKYWRHIYELKWNSILRGIERGELRAGVDPRDVINYMHLLYGGFSRLLNHTYLRLAPRDFTRMVEVSIDCMRSEFS